MVFTRKFSQFVQGGVIATGNEPVGLEDGANTIWDYISQSSNEVVEIITQDTSGLAVRDWVRPDITTGLYVPGLATSSEEAEIAGVVKAILSPTQFILMQSGYIEPGTPGFGSFTPGVPRYLSDIALGADTETPPTENGRVYLPLFLPDSANSGWVIGLKLGTIIGTPAPIPSSNSSDSNFADLTQPGNMFTIGQFIYVIANNTFDLADGTDLEKSQTIGAIKSSGDPTFTVQFAGYATNVISSAVDSTGTPILITSSTVYYLSDVVPGAICPTPPTLPGTSSRPVYISVSAPDGTGFILPQRPLITGESDNDPNIVIVDQTGHGFTRGQAVRVLSADTYTLAQANNFTNTRAVGIVIRVIDADTFVLQTEGLCAEFYAPYVNFPLGPNTQYYLSDVTPGLLTTIEPTTVGSYSKPMLCGLNDSTGYILEQKPTLIGGSGSIIQTQSTLQRNFISFPSLSPGSWTTIPSFSVTITPSSIVNKILLQAMFRISSSAFPSHYSISARIIRNGSLITNSIGNVATVLPSVPCTTQQDLNRNFEAFNANILFVDEPSTTSPCTYEFQVYGPSGTFYFNVVQLAAAGNWPGVSTIVAQEIG